MDENRRAADLRESHRLLKRSFWFTPGAAILWSEMRYAARHAAPAATAPFPSPDYVFNLHQMAIVIAIHLAFLSIQECLYNSPGSLRRARIIRRLCVIMQLQAAALFLFAAVVLLNAYVAVFDAYFIVFRCPVDAPRADCAAAMFIASLRYAVGKSVLVLAGYFA